MNIIGREGREEVYALLAKHNLKVKREEHRITAELEYVKWKVTSSNFFLNILGIYRPPGSSIPQFLDIFTELLVDILTSNTNLVILGNFNIHVNKIDDPNAGLFLDTMTALGMKQHVRGPTHRSGNCLDLIFTEEMSKTKAIECSHSAYVSDHSSIQCILNIPKESCNRKEITYRKLKDVDLAQLVREMSLEDIKTENLDEMVQMLEENLSKALNKQTPVVTKVITERKKKPWFGDDLKQQKRIVRRREKVLENIDHNPVGLHSSGKGRNTEKMLFDAKTACYSKEVEDCKGDVKGLYRMVNKLMGTASENPLPSHTSDKDLAEEFADFFMGKIQKRRDNLTGYPIYEPTKKITTRLAEFRPFEQTEVKKIILSMKTKSCELDALPTRLLKQCIEDIFPPITNLCKYFTAGGYVCI